MRDSGPRNGQLQGAPRAGEGFRRGRGFRPQPAERRKANLTSARRPEGPMAPGRTGSRISAGLSGMVGEARSPQVPLQRPSSPDEPWHPRPRHLSSSEDEASTTPAHSLSRFLRAELIPRREGLARAAGGSHRPRRARSELGKLGSRWGKAEGGEAGRGLGPLAAWGMGRRSSNWPGGPAAPPTWCGAVQAPTPTQPGELAPKRTQRDFCVGMCRRKRALVRTQ